MKTFGIPKTNSDVFSESYLQSLDEGAHISGGHKIRIPFGESLKKNRPVALIRGQAVGVKGDVSSEGVGGLSFNADDMFIKFLNNPNKIGWFIRKTFGSGSNFVFVIGTAYPSEGRFVPEREILITSTNTSSYLETVINLDDDNFVFFYRNNSHLYSIHARVSTNTVNAPVQITSTTIHTSSSANKFDYIKLSATQIAVLYAGNASGQNHTCRIATLSGGNVSYGTAVQYNSVTSNMQCAGGRLTDTTFLVYWSLNTSDNNWRFKIGTVSGSSVSFSTETTYATSNASYYGAVLIPRGASAFALITANGSQGKYGYVTVSGSTITVSNATYSVNNFNSFQDCIAWHQIDTDHYILIGAGGNSNLTNVWFSGQTILTTPTQKAPINLAMIYASGMYGFRFISFLVGTNKIFWTGVVSKGSFIITSLIYRDNDTYPDVIPTLGFPPQATTNSGNLHLAQLYQFGTYKTDHTRPIRDGIHGGVDNSKFFVVKFSPNGNAVRMVEFGSLVLAGETILGNFFYFGDGRILRTYYKSDNKLYAKVYYLADDLSLSIVVAETKILDATTHKNPVATAILDCGKVVLVSRNDATTSNMHFILNVGNSITVITSYTHAVTTTGFIQVFKNEYIVGNSTPQVYLFKYNVGDSTLSLLDTLNVPSGGYAFTPISTIRLNNNGDTAIVTTNASETTIICFRISSTNKLLASILTVSGLIIGNVMYSRRSIYGDGESMFWILSGTVSVSRVGLLPDGSMKIYRAQNFNSLGYTTVPDHALTQFLGKRLYLGKADYTHIGVINLDTLELEDEITMPTFSSPSFSLNIQLAVSGKFIQYWLRYNDSGEKCLTITLSDDNRSDCIGLTLEDGLQGEEKEIIIGDALMRYSGVVPLGAGKDGQLTSGNYNKPILYPTIKNIMQLRT